MFFIIKYYDFNIRNTGIIATIEASSIRANSKHKHSGDLSTACRFTKYMGQIARLL